MTKIREEITADRIDKMMVSIGEMLDTYRPDYVVVENVWEQSGKDFANNVKTMNYLAMIIGGVKFWCANHMVAFEMLMPNAWRSVVGIKTGAKVSREELKKASIEFARDTYRFEPQTDDEADATALVTAAYIRREESSGEIHSIQ